MVSLPVFMIANIFLPGNESSGICDKEGNDDADGYLPFEKISERQTYENNISR